MAYYANTPPTDKSIRLHEEIGWGQKFIGLQFVTHKGLAGTPAAHDLVGRGVGVASVVNGERRGLIHGCQLSEKTCASAATGLRVKPAMTRRGRNDTAGAQ